MMLSFIVIGKNEGWRLEKCLLSIHRFIKEEEIDDYEIIYIDSQSSDQSLIIANKNAVDKIFLITGICNAAIGRNIGAKESKGNILFFLDADMELIPGFYKDIVDYQGNLVYPFVSGIELDIFYDNNWNFIESKKRRPFIEGVDQYSITTGGLFVINRDCWFSIGGMDNCQKKSQDLDLGIRLSANKLPLCRKGKLWVYHNTRYYAIRSGSLEVVKYSSRLTRKHIFNFNAQKYLFSSNYSFWILSLCIVMSIYFKSINPMFVYLVVAMYRSYRTLNRTKIKLNPLFVFVKQLVKDAIFLYNFLFFWPKSIKMEYTIKENAT